MNLLCAPAITTRRPHALAFSRRLSGEVGRLTCRWIAIKIVAPKIDTSSVVRAGRSHMHWIENVLHVDPDGGSGLLEAVYLAAIGALAAVPIVRRSLRRRQR